MKQHLFIPFLLTLLTSVVSAQDIAVQGTYLATPDEYGFIPDAEAVEGWSARYGIDLFAYPVDMEVLVVPGQSENFTFGDADKVFLQIEADLDGPFWTLRAERKDGTEVLHKRLEGEHGRFLIEVPASAFRLTVQNGNGHTAGALRVTRAYVEPKIHRGTRDFGFNTALECHLNAMCPVGAQWTDQIRSAVRIMMVLEEGIGWCSGTLLNNTEKDGTPLILSAEHCIGSYTPVWEQWRFDFNYRSPGCDAPGEEPDFQSLTGCTFLAKHRDSDFLLLEIDDDIPVQWEVYFSGWNRDYTEVPARSGLIHHPSGDIAKVSRDNDKPQVWDKSINWVEGYSTPPNTHLRARFDLGTYESGSSGSGYYDTLGLLVGQLHGGSSDCNINTAYSGILGVSWDIGDKSTDRLHDWLDPAGTDSIRLAGMEHPDKGNVFSVVGTVRDPKGRPVKNVEIALSGSGEEVFMTDDNGAFTIPTLPRTQIVNLDPAKLTNPWNGVTAIDLVLIQKHLLGVTPFEEQYQLLASDATANDVLSAGDLLVLQKLLLGLIQFFPSQESWVFDPPLITLDGPVEDVVEINFMAIKVGDVNGTADPEK